MENQLVIFTLAGQSYGVNIAVVDGIIKLQDITKVPHAPGFVMGITNLRGTVLPVIDLHTRFDLPPEEATRDSRIIVVESNGSKIGMVVDAVTEVLRVPAEAIEPPAPLMITINSAFITGIAKIADRLVILLDLAQVLNAQDHMALQNLSVAV